MGSHEAALTCHLNPAQLPLRFTVAGRKAANAPMISPRFTNCCRDVNVTTDQDNADRLRPNTIRNVSNETA